MVFLDLKLIRIKNAFLGLNELCICDQNSYPEL